MNRGARGLTVAAASGSLFAGLAGAVQADRVGKFDDAVRMGVHSLASPILTDLAQTLTWLGSVAVIALFLACALVALIAARRAGLATFLAVTMAGALALENALKFWFCRVRPPGFFGFEPTTYSFPSGHALLSLCFYASLAIIVSTAAQSRAIRVGVWTAAICLILIIGFTRVYLGVHYPSDVLGGYLVGITWLELVLAFGQTAAARD